MQRTSLHIEVQWLKVYSTNFQSNGQSLLLNTITGVNCIQSVFRHCKIKQSKVTNRTITDTENKVKWINVNILLLTLNSLSAFNTEKFIWFLQHLSNKTIQIFLFMLLTCYSNVMYMPCKWLNVKFECLSLNAMQADWEKHFSDFLKPF